MRPVVATLCALRSRLCLPLPQALLKLTVEFRKEQTRFLNKKEAQKGIKVGGTLGVAESDSQVRRRWRRRRREAAAHAARDVSVRAVRRRECSLRRGVPRRSLGACSVAWAGLWAGD